MSNSCSIADVPSEPLNLSVTSVSEKSIGLRWSEPESDGGCDLIQYVIEMREVYNSCSSCCCNAVIADRVNLSRTKAVV